MTRTWLIVRVQHYNEYIRENSTKEEVILIRTMNTWIYKVITNMTYNSILGTPETVEDMNEHQENKANPYQVWRIRDVIRHINLENVTYGCLLPSINFLQFKSRKVIKNKVWLSKIILISFCIAFLILYYWLNKSGND